MHRGPRKNTPTKKRQAPWGRSAFPARENEPPLRFDEE
jgi:hypothetical protein